jgi:hypothetical protein
VAVGKKEPMTHKVQNIRGGQVFGIPVSPDHGTGGAETDAGRLAYVTGAVPQESQMVRHAVFRGPAQDRCQSGRIAMGIGQNQQNRNPPPRPARVEVPLRIFYILQELPLVSGTQFSILEVLCSTIGR